MIMQFSEDPLVNATFYMVIVTSCLASFTFILAYFTHRNGFKNRRMDFILKQLEYFYIPIYDAIIKLEDINFNFSKGFANLIQTSWEKKRYLCDLDIIERFDTINSLFGEHASGITSKNLLLAHVNEFKKVIRDRINLKIEELQKLCGYKKQIIRKMIQDIKYEKKLNDAFDRIIEGEKESEKSTEDKPKEK